MRHIRVLTWNLFHGRSVPPAKRSLLGEFSQRIAAWDWDVALLQEVPPWWPPLLATAAGSEQRLARTSRNEGLPLRRAIASRWPDVAKSNGGGCNAVLARGAIVSDERLALRRRPERRVAQLVALECGLCVANFHGSTRRALAREELARLCERALAFAGNRPLLLGGDLNLRDPQAPLQLVARGTVDFLFAHGLAARGEGEFLDRSLQGERIELSDHRALAVTLHRA
ncbi:MAG: endonuclease/exonuclease/phosphatase family protein [Solirubrobacteraceae bacterium]